MLQLAKKLAGQVQNFNGTPNTGNLFESTRSKTRSKTFKRGLKVKKLDKNWVAGVINYGLNNGFRGENGVSLF